MFAVLLTAVFIAICCVEADTQVGPENCESKHLDQCERVVPRTRVGLPRTKEELDEHCNAYNVGMSCIEKWMKRCLPLENQQIARNKISGARAVMRFLCANNTALRREYIQQEQCWTRVSSGWTHCSSELQGVIYDISQTTQLKQLNINDEICCAREQFLACVAHVALSCPVAGNKLLQRLAWVLAQDLGKCPEERSYCAAPPPPYATPLLTTLITLLLYLLTF